MSFDAVISNPPYSLKWQPTPAASIDGFDLAPKSKADYQFIVEGLSRLNDDGVAVYVLPHGVLFRGGVEGKIRQQIIERNCLDAVIGLPDKLFDVTSIPVFLMVLKRHRPTTDVLFIDASKEYTKAKNKKILGPNHVQKIVEAYQARQDVDKYSHVATLAEIKENEFNLNIPRYVDTFEPDPPIHLDQVMKELTEVDAEIEHNEQDLATMFDELHGTTPEAQAELEKFRKYFGRRTKAKREEQMTLL